MAGLARPFSLERAGQAGDRAWEVARRQVASTSPVSSWP